MTYRDEFHEGAGLVVWVDYINVNLREFTDADADRLTMYDSEDGDPICMTSDAAAFLDAVRACLELDSVRERIAARGV